jgi:hypothetical protein
MTVIVRSRIPKQSPREESPFKVASLPTGFCGKIRTMTDNIVGVRFQKFGKVYHFSAEASPDIQNGDFAVVETSRGQQLGEVVQILDSESVPREGYLKPILRVANPRDLVLAI